MTGGTATTCEDNTVDVKKATHTNDIGDAPLVVVRCSGNHSGARLIVTDLIHSRGGNDMKREGWIGEYKFC